MDDMILIGIFLIVLGIVLDVVALRKWIKAGDVNFKKRHSNSFISIPKYASTLAFDDNVLFCNTADDIELVKRKVESNLNVISHVWHPQELLQLLMLSKAYLDKNNNLYSMHLYYFERYLESLVMNLNWYNGYIFEQNGGLTDNELKGRKLIFDEIHHLYDFAKSVYNYRENNVERREEENEDIHTQPKKLPGEDIDIEGLSPHTNPIPESSHNGSCEQKPSPKSKEVINVTNVPKPRTSIIDGDERLLHDLQNPHESLFLQEDEKKLVGNGGNS